MVQSMHAYRMETEPFSEDGTLLAAVVLRTQAHSTSPIERTQHPQRGTKSRKRLPRYAVVHNAIVVKSCPCIGYLTV